MGSDVSHAQLIMWTVGFFFSGMGLYAFVFWLQTRGLRKMVTAAVTDFKTFKVETHDSIEKLSMEIGKLEEKKVDVILYIDDKNKAKELIAELQTKDRCEWMQKACMGNIKPQLEDIKSSLVTVIDNQQEFMGVRGKLDLVVERQKQVIDRIDKHLNGHGHE